MSQLLRLAFPSVLMKMSCTARFTPVTRMMTASPSPTCTMYTRSDHQQKVETTVPMILMYLQAYFVLFMTASKLLNDKIYNFSQHCSSAPFPDSLSQFPFPIPKPQTSTPPSNSPDSEKDSPDIVVLLRRTKGLAKLWALWFDETLWDQVHVVKDSTLVVMRNLVSRKFWGKLKIKLEEIPLFENNL